MRKYLAAAIFAAFTVCTIGIYYVQASLERMPQFRLTTISGDESEGNPLVLRGTYRSGEYFENLKIDAAGSHYVNEQSWSEQMYQGKFSQNPVIDRLIDEFPGFMRGHHSADYGDDEFVIRAEWIPRFTVDRNTITYIIHIDILDKSTKRTRTLKIELYDTDTAIQGNVVQTVQFNRSSIIDVQRIGDVLKVAVFLEQSHDGRLITSVVRVYDIDWNSGEVIGSADVEHGIQAGDSQEISVTVLQEYDWTQPHTLLALEVVLMNVNDTGNRTNANIAVLTRHLTAEKRHLMIYDYIAGHTTVIPLELDAAEQGKDSPVYRIGDYAMHVNTTDDGVSISSYRLADGANMFERRWTPDELRADAHISAKIAGPNRLYLLYESGGTPAVTLLEPESGQFVYQAEVTVDDIEENEKRALLNNLSIGAVTSSYRK